MEVFWYRKTLKKTTENKFELMKVYATNSHASNVCNEFRTTRSNLVAMLSDPESKIEGVEQTFFNYLSIIDGALHPELLNKDSNAATVFSNKIRQLVTFFWTQSTSYDINMVCTDIAFEKVNMTFQSGLFYSDKARIMINQLQRYDEISVHMAFKLLKKAAGFFKACQETSRSFLKEIHNYDKAPKISDIDERVLAGHCLQCMAEASEISLLRAKHKKLDAQVECDLCIGVLRYYSEACRELATLPSTGCKELLHWLTFLNLKKQQFECLSYHSFSQVLYDKEKCGQALSSIKEAQNGLTLLHRLVRQFQDLRPSNCKEKVPQNFEPNLIKEINRQAEKLNNANMIIYHQKADPNTPPLPHDTTYGKITHEELEIPKCPLWTQKAYEGFEMANVKV